MVYKKKLFLIIFFSFFNTNIFGDIIYDKAGVIITNQDLNNYIDLNKKKFSQSLTKNIALKNLILSEKTISDLSRNNQLFIKAVDNKLSSEIKNFEYLSIIEKNLLRFNIIRKEFIYEYYEKNLNIEDIKKSIIPLKNEIIPLSLNGCLTITKTKLLLEINDIEKIIFQNLNNLNGIKISINNELYDLCFDRNIINKLDYYIFNFVQSITEDDFKEFIYSKL